MNQKTKASVQVTTVALLIVSMVNIKADILIDTFSSYQSLSLSGNPAGPKSDFASVADAGTLGGERDVWLDRTSPAPNAGNISMDVNGSLAGAITYASSAGTKGDAIISYDGADGVSGINYTGLGSVDLTQSGINTGFRLGTTSDNGATATFTIYTDATHVSTFDLAVAADPSFTFSNYFANFSDFTATGSAGGADFTNVGAITLELNGNAHAGTDIGVNYFVATVPEPSGSLLILSAGFFFILKRPHSSRRRMS